MKTTMKTTMKTPKLLTTALLMLSVGVGGIAHAATLTWDADPGTAGIQDGAGTWDTTTNNWYDGANNVLWPNTTADEAILGDGGSISNAQQINLDGGLFHKPCAKCQDCQCQISLSNFCKNELGDETVLLCKTHYMKRFHEDRETQVLPTLLVPHGWKRNGARARPLPPPCAS